jgi:hypothetical protein
MVYGKEIEQGMQGLVGREESVRVAQPRRLFARGLCIVLSAALPQAFVSGDRCTLTSVSSTSQRTLRVSSTVLPISMSSCASTSSAVRSSGTAA